jgi:ComEC/Rec2-related protein
VVAGVLSGFVMVVGNVESLQRALAMSLFALVARLLGRPVRSLDVWAGAGCVLLWSDPQSVRSLGLQFSLLATLGVLIAVRRLNFLRGWMRGAGHLRRGTAGAVGTVAVGTAATLVVLPLQLHYFGEVSFVGPIATVLFLPLVGALLIVSLALVALDPIPAVSTALTRVVEGCARALDWMLLEGRNAVPAPLEVAAPEAILYYGGLATAVWGLGWQIRVVGGALIALSFVVGG